MPETDELLALVGDVYDTTLDAGLWPEVLRKTCAFVGGSMANLFSEDAVKKSASRFYTWGDDPEYSKLYMEKYAPLNPLLPTGMFFPVGEVYGMGDIMPYEELQRTRFYREWMKPQGYLDFVASNLEKSATAVAPIAVIRHERDGYIDDRARRRMGALVPHVRRAVLIGKVIELHKIEAAALADTLDGLAAGMFLVDATGRVVHANAAGHRMIEEGLVVRVAAGRITATDAQADRALQDTFAAADAGDDAVGEKGIAVPLPVPDRDRHVAHILPLTSAQRRRAGTAYSAVAAMFVQTSALDGPSPMEAMARQFNLTNAELRVMLAIVNVGGVPEVAEALGIGEGTVRTHLYRLFTKTGATRQADLVKIVASFASPLAH